MVSNIVSLCIWKRRRRRGSRWQDWQELYYSETEAWQWLYCYSDICGRAVLSHDITKKTFSVPRYWGALLICKIITMWERNHFKKC